MTDSYSQEDEPKEAFFVDAKNYLIAAGTLLNQRQQLYLDSGSIYMLYFHSAELALKAFLMYRGIKSSELKKNGSITSKKCIQKHCVWGSIQI